MTGLRKVALIGLLVLMAVISSGCIGESQQMYVCQSGDTVSNPDLCPKDTPPPTTSAPTTTPIPRPLETPAPTTTVPPIIVPPTNSPPPKKGETIEITNTYLGVGHTGYIITGIITNIGNVNIIGIELTATAYDADGLVSATGLADYKTGAIKTILQVGESSPFIIKLSFPISPINDYKIQSNFDTTDKIPRKFDFINMNSEITEDRFNLLGEVMNLEGDVVPEGAISIYVTLKDSQGNILDIVHAWNKISMAKGETSPFRFSIHSSNEAWAKILNKTSVFDIYAY